MSTATTQAAEVANLKHKLELDDEDITLINRQLDEAQGMCWGSFVYACILV